MIHITIEINGLQQLLQIEPQGTKKFLAKIEQLFHTAQFAKLKEKTPLIRYSGDEQIISLKRIVDLLGHLAAFIEARSEEFPGITILVQRSSLDDEAASMADKANQIYLLPEEDGIWCSSSAADLIDHFVNFESSDPFYKIIDFKREKIARTEIPDIFHSGDMLDQLLDHLLDAYQSNSRTITILVAEEGRGKHLLLSKLLKLLEGKGGYVPWLEAMPYDEMGPAFLPFLRAIDTDIVEDNLPKESSYDIQLWERIKRLFQVPFFFWTETDAVSAFLLYLKAYERKMRTEYQIPLLVIHAFDTFRPEVRSFFLRIFRDTSWNGIVPLLTVRDESALESIEKTQVFYLKRWLEDLGDRANRELSCPYQLYLPELKKAGRTFRAHSLEVIKDSRTEIQTVYYCCAVLDGLLTKESLLPLFSDLGIGNDDAQQSLFQLKSFGLLTNSERYYPVDKNLNLILEKRLPQDYRRFKQVIETHILKDFRNHEFFKLIRVARRIDVEPSSWLQIYRVFVERLLTDVEVPAIPQCEHAVDLFGKSQDILNHCITLLAKMWDGQVETAAEEYKKLFIDDFASSAEAASESWVKALLTYAEGEYLWRSRASGDAALSKVKSSLLQVQELQFPELESRAMILLGKVMLTSGKLTDAAEYFRQGRQKTFATDLASVACESTALTAVTYFLTGDYSLAASHAQASEQKASSTGRRRWQRYAMMLRGRIEFELGRYNQAQKIFEQLLAFEQLYFNEERHNFFKPWLARAMMYQGYVDKAGFILESIPETAESLFFQAECELLNRDLDAAYSFVRKALEQLRDEPQEIIPIYQLPLNGFEPYENLGLKIPGIYNVLRQLLYSLEGFLLHEMGRTEDSEMAFQKLFEQERNTRQDPYRHLYYYFRTITLPADNEKEELNMSTYLSKGFQSLQKISGRISDPSDRRSYTTMNYWNSRLYNLSKRYKLV